LGSFSTPRAVAYDVEDEDDDEAEKCAAVVQFRVAEHPF